MKKSQKKKPMYDPDVPSAFEAWLFSKNMFTRLAFLSCQVLLYAIRPMFTCPRMLILEDYILAFTQVLYVGSSYYVAGWGAVLYLFCASILG